MKVGIITINDAKPNFGNKLQNYASVTVFQKLNCKVQTVLTEKQMDVKEYYVRRFLNWLSIYHLSENQYFWIRFCRFHEFDRKYLKLCDSLLRGKNVQEEFDYFAVGSDQVWNTEWWYSDLKKKAFLLLFAKNHQKICMAPSFGRDNLPKEWEKSFADSLLTFRKLSVREEQGAKIIREVTGREAEVVIDPTMMLEVKEWRALEHKLKVKSHKGKYILKYFLGEQSKKQRKEIEDLAQESGLEIYELLDKEERELYSAGPREFLYLIDHAELICTDSFHAVVFSILFDKPFLIFDREENGVPVMNSRIDTLLKQFEVERHVISDRETVFQCDYTRAKEILRTKKRQAYQFLIDSIKQNPGDENGKKIKNRIYG